MQNDYRRLVHAVDKSTIASFPSHEVESEENTLDSSATSCHDQSQPLYGMLIDMYPGQPQPPTQIGGKSIDLRMSESSVRERGPSEPAAVGPVFRNELLRLAPEPPKTMQTLNDPFRPFAYSTGQCEYNTRRSTYLTDGPRLST
jgi:hypothetical protein